MRDGSLSDPGALRRWWWRGSQRTRLVTMCLGTALALVVSGVVLSGVGRAPAPAAAHPTIPTTSWSTGTGEASGGSPATPPAAGDRLIAVSAVPSVNLLDGVDTATNQPVAVRVLGILATPTCWAEQARARAEGLVRGKQVWLAGGNEHQPDPDGRVPARVSLPEGQDYAHAVVSIGAAQLDTNLGTAPNQEDLATAEADARRARRGVWGPACDASRASEPSDPGGPSSADEQVDQQTTTHQQPPAPGGPPGGPPATTTTPPAQDDVQRGVRLGAPCSPAGARGVTDRDENVVCTATGGGPARWRKA